MSTTDSGIETATPALTPASPIAPVEVASDPEACIDCMEEAILAGEPVSLAPLRMAIAASDACTCDPAPDAPCSPDCAVCA